MTNAPILGLIKAVPIEANHQILDRLSIKPTKFIDGMFRNVPKHVSRVEPEMLPESTVNDLLRQASKQIEELGIDITTLEYYVLKKMSDRLEVYLAHPDITDAVDATYMEVPWKIDSFMEGDQARQIINLLGVPKLNRAFNDKNSGKIRVRIWRKSVVTSVLGNTKVYFHPNGGASGSACFGYQGPQDSINAIYDIFSKQMNLHSPNMSTGGWLMAEPTRIEISVAASSGRPYRFDFDELKPELAHKIWTMAHCHTFHNRSQLFRNRTMAQASDNLASSQEDMFRNKCTRCVMKCAMRNTAKEEQSTPFLPQINGTWLNADSAKKELAELNPNIWRQEPEFSRDKIRNMLAFSTKTIDLIRSRASSESRSVIDSFLNIEHEEHYRSDSIFDAISANTSVLHMVGRPNNDAYFLETDRPASY